MKIKSNLLLGILITVIGFALTDVWFDVYKQLVIKLFGKHVVDQLTFKLISAIFLTLLVYVLVTNISKLTLSHFGIKEVKTNS